MEILQVVRLYWSRWHHREEKAPLTHPTPKKKSHAAHIGEAHEETFVSRRRHKGKHAWMLWGVGTSSKESNQDNQALDALLSWAHCARMHTCAMERPLDTWLGTTGNWFFFLSGSFLIRKRQTLNRMQPRLNESKGVHYCVWESTLFKKNLVLCVCAPNAHI